MTTAFEDVRTDKKTRRQSGQKGLPLLANSGAVNARSPRLIFGPLEGVVSSSPPHFFFYLRFYLIYYLFSISTVVVALHRGCVTAGFVSGTLLAAATLTPK